MKTLFIALLLVPCVSFADQMATTENGKKVILKDDGTWVHAEAQSEKKGKSNEYAEANEVIRQKCKTDWSENFQMRAFCEQQQKGAVEKLKAGKPKDISNEEYAIVQKKCAADWPQNYLMRQFCEEQQFKGVRDLKKQ